MNILEKLDELGLNPDNSIVIGSGILSVLRLRDSDDLDLVVNNSKYQELSKDAHFARVQAHGREILTDELYEINASWNVLGKDYTFDDLLKQSTIIDGVRYITPEFLLAVKESWLNDDDVRQKDIDDVKLIKSYLGKQLSRKSVCTDKIL